ncbi:MAG: hypothetical protein AVDCRST_MAG56-4328, partial [uncultured Cytophagales bacterium]
WAFPATARPSGAFDNASTHGISLFSKRTPSSHVQMPNREVLAR